jgi:aryl-alcohol dehydrogenase-like predicted oxidoreductase
VTWIAASPDARREQFGRFLLGTGNMTGVTAGGPDLSPERVRQQLKRSIAVLGRVDLYLAHAVDPGTSWSDSLPVFSAAVGSRPRAPAQVRVLGVDWTAELAERVNEIFPAN